MRRVFMKYKAINYTLADALRRDPMYGKRHFHIDIDDDSISDKELQDAAIKTAPSGYRLYDLEIRQL